MNAVDFHTVLTVLFVIAFVCMVVWVYLPSRKSVYQKAAQLPFDNEPRQPQEDQRND